MSIACWLGRHEWNAWHPRQVRSGVRVPYNTDLPLRQELTWVHHRECTRPGCAAAEMLPFDTSKNGKK